MGLMDLTDLLLDELPIRQPPLVLGLVVLISSVTAELGLNETTACGIGYATAILVVWYFRSHCIECLDRFRNTDRSPARKKQPIYQITISFGPEIHREPSRRTPNRIMLVGTFQPFQKSWEPGVHKRILLDDSDVPAVDEIQYMKFGKKIRKNRNRISAR